MFLRGAFRIAALALIGLFGAVPPVAGQDTDQCVGEVGCWACYDDESGCIVGYCGGLIFVCNDT